MWLSFLHQEDWRILWGVLVGCLALLKRTKKFGMVDNSDARKLAKSFLINVQVQSLAVRDRKVNSTGAIFFYYYGMWVSGF